MLGIMLMRVEFVRSVEIVANSVQMREFVMSVKMRLCCIMGAVWRVAQVGCSQRIRCVSCVQVIVLNALLLLLVPNVPMDHRSTIKLVSPHARQPTSPKTTNVNSVQAVALNVPPPHSASNAPSPSPFISINAS